jgi:hypothetical protein
MSGLPLSGIKVIMLLDNPFVSDARVEKEAVALIEHGAIVTVWCEKNDSLPGHDERNGIAIKRCIDPILYAPLKKGNTSVLKLFVDELLKEDLNILHCHDFHMLAIGAEVKKKNTTIKLIYDAHEFLIGWPFYQTAGNWKNRFKGWIVWNYLKVRERRDIKIADAVITITSGIADRLRKGNRLKLEPIILGNYVERTTIKADKSYFHKKYNLPIGTKVLIHSGSIYFTNNQIDSLFKCIVEKENVVLVFIGNRPRFFELKSLVERNEVLSQNIYFHEYLDNQSENINLIASGDIGLMHIRDKWVAHQLGFSNRFIEYVMAELPSVVTPQEFTEQINHKYHCCSFYSENDAVGFARSLGTILENLDTYTANVKKAKENLDWATESLKLIELYSTFNV